MNRKELVAWCGVLSAIAMGIALLTAGNYVITLTWIAMIQGALQVSIIRFFAVSNPWLSLVGLGLGTGLVLLAYAIAVPDNKIPPALKVGAYALVGCLLPIFIGLAVLSL